MGITFDEESADLVFELITADPEVWSVVKNRWGAMHPPTILNNEEKNDLIDSIAVKLGRFPSIVYREAKNARTKRPGGFIRLRCRMPDQPAPGPRGIQINVSPTIADCEAVYVDDDGKELPIKGVLRFTFDSGPVTGPGVGVRARLELADVEVDLDTGERAPAPEEKGEPVYSGNGVPIGHTVPRGRREEKGPAPILSIIGKGKIEGPIELAMGEHRKVAGRPYVVDVDKAKSRTVEWSATVRPVGCHGTAHDGRPCELTNGHEGECVSGYVREIVPDEDGRVSPEDRIAHMEGRARLPPREAREIIQEKRCTCTLMGQLRGKTFGETNPDCPEHSRSPGRTR